MSEWTFRYAGRRDSDEDYGGTAFDGRAWEVETAEGRTIVPEALAEVLAAHQGVRLR